MLIVIKVLINVHLFVNELCITLHVSVGLSVRRQESKTQNCI